MNCMKLHGLIIGAALLSSCAPRWVNLNKTKEEFYKDRAECKAYDEQSAKHGSSRLHYDLDPTGDRFGATWSRGEVEERCMKNRGWWRPARE